jgi:hypothetical protein
MIAYERTYRADRLILRLCPYILAQTSVTQWLNSELAALCIAVVPR